MKSTARRKRTSKPKRIVQRTLFDEPKPSEPARRKPIPAKPRDLPENWSDVFYPPATEDVARRRRVLGW